MGTKTQKKKARNRKIIYHNSSRKYKKIKRSAHESKIKETSKANQISNLEITSLMDALITITHDPKTIEFKQMVKIIKDAGELNADEVGEIEVDLGRLSFETLKKLQLLEKNLKTQ